MIETVIEFSRYLLVMLFGAAVSVRFAGMEHKRKNYLVLGFFTVVFFLLQVASLLLFGMDMTRKIYPLLSHFPVFVFIIIYLNRSWLISLTSVFVGFLCCQPPRWIGAVVGEILNSATADHLGYIITAFFMYYFLEKYVVRSTRYLMDRSAKSCLLFAAMPAFYYFFDLTTTVYTDILYTGTRAVVQFMPFVTSAFYLVFILLYYAETQKQVRIQRERDMLDSQLEQAQTEFVYLRQMQQNAAAYRHDMRHHFTLLHALATQERMDEIIGYLRTAQSDMDAITPIRYCENETANITLSAFAAKAKQSDILFTPEVKLPDSLPLSDTELCSLLSNALENAIHATVKVADSNARQIKLRIYSKNKKLCIDIRNTFHTVPVFHNGLPVSTEQAHGFGTKSMVYIVENHGGVYRFLVKDGWFLFQAAI